MIVLPHKGEHGHDGTVIRICQNIPTEKAIVPITRVNDFVFNEELLKYDTAVIIDFVEYGWDFDLEESGTHLFGVNTNNFPHFRGDEWKKFDDWVAGLKNKVYFKREMVKDVYPPNYHPIDYPCWFEVPQPVSKEEFDARPISVFNFWGRSHESRLHFHSNVWKWASEKGFSVCDNIYHMKGFMEEEKGEKWVSFWQPHYARLDILEMLKISALSKITAALPGAGRKTFRGTGEAPFNSVVLMHEDNLMYSYDWEDGQNCIKFEIFGNEEVTIRYALTNPNLYYIYVNCVNNCRNYQIDNYVKNYILPKINAI